MGKKPWKNHHRDEQSVQIEFKRINRKPGKPDFQRQFKLQKEDRKGRQQDSTAEPHKDNRGP